MPMPEPRLEVSDALGHRIVTIEKSPFAIGRRETNDLRLGGSEVSRDHAEIVQEGSRFVLRDRGSRFGTYVNGETVTERVLEPGDTIRVGRGGGAELVFLLAEQAGVTAAPAASAAIGDLRHVAALLEGLRALGSGRVLDDVLALVMDSAIEVSGAERGFIMLEAEEGGPLEFKLGRARGRSTLPGSRFETSRKIPEQVFETGQPRIIADLLDGDLANVHMGTVALGIRHVLCVPLRLVRYLDTVEDEPVEKNIGVLYLDSREKGSLLSSSTRSALETLATEAAVAIENARLYRETLEKARLDQEIRIAAEIQQALLPRLSYAGAFFDAAGSTLPCRSIGGDFFDYVELPGGSFAFALGDVAGKGPPAALLERDGPGHHRGAERVDRWSVRDADARQSRDAASRHRGALRDDVLWRARIERAGHLVQRGAQSAVRARQERRAPARTRRTAARPVRRDPVSGGDRRPRARRLGDRLQRRRLRSAQRRRVRSSATRRIAEVARAHFDHEPPVLLEALLSSVRTFATGAPQSDDVTALVVRYRGPLSNGKNAAGDDITRAISDDAKGDGAPDA